MPTLIKPPRHSRTDARPHRTSRAAGGFTLTETALALVIVGTGVLASLELFGSCTVENNVATRATTARMLAENMREAMANLSFSDPVSGVERWGPEEGEGRASYDDIDDFDGPWQENGMTPPDGEEFSPPIDSMRAEIPALSQYSQYVTVMAVDPNDPSGNSNEAAPTLPRTVYTGAVRVRVRVRYRTSPEFPWQALYTMSWVRAND
jgi:type II secretory pathway pseudopilin PulG